MTTLKASYFKTSHQGKIVYKTPKEAQEVVDRMNAENRRMNLTERMEYYRCKFCKNYHIGHELGQDKLIKEKVRKGRGR